MVDGVGTDLDPIGVELLHLVGGEVAAAPDEAAHDVGDGPEVVRLEDRVGGGVEVLVAVVEGQHDRPVGQRPEPGQVFAQLDQRDRVEAVLSEVVHLLLEIRRRGGEAPADRVVAPVRRGADVVVHEDWHLDLRAAGRDHRQPGVGRQNLPGGQVGGDHHRGMGGEPAGGPGLQLGAGRKGPDRRSLECGQARDDRRQGDDRKRTHPPSSGARLVHLEMSLSKTASGLPTVEPGNGKLRPVVAVDANPAAKAAVTGTERFTWEVVRRLGSLAPDVDWRFYSSRPAPGLNADLTVLPFPRLWSQARLPVELAMKRPALFLDLAHVVPAWCPVPAVKVFHDLAFERFPGAYRPAELAYLRWTARRAATTSRALVAVSESTRRDLVELYGVDPDRVVVVHEGGGEGTAEPGDPGADGAGLRRFGIDRPFLLNVGRVEPRKNQLTALAAVRRLPGTLLVVAGAVHDDALAGPTTLTDVARQGIFRYFPGVDNNNASNANPSVDRNGNPIPPAGATGPLSAIDLFGNCTYRGAPVANCSLYRDLLLILPSRATSDRSTS